MLSNSPPTTFEWTRRASMRAHASAGKATPILSPRAAPQTDRLVFKRRHGCRPRRQGRLPAALTRDRGAVAPRELNSAPIRVYHRAGARRPFASDIVAAPAGPEFTWVGDERGRCP